MNYRHAFHAGNFADVFKHIILTRVLTYAMRKDSALRYLDTHAGVGLYDLSGDEAQRTGEWHDGIERLMLYALSPHMRDLCAPYFAAMRQDSERAHYPGSPLIAQRLLRAQDRLTLCEWHEHDHASLQRIIGRDRRAKALHIDGYVALNAYVPPIEKRGVVLIDPPFESRDEFSQISRALLKATSKWPQGCYLIWYPIKDEAAIRRFHADLLRLDLPPTLSVQLYVDRISDGPLTATGLVIINPPYVLEDELRQIMPELVACLGRSAAAYSHLTWLVPPD